jgi:hypothetical protein
MRMRPSYALPFHDWSEIGPGVRRATLNAFVLPEPEPALPEQAIEIPTPMLRTTNAADLMILCDRFNLLSS